MRRVGEVTRKPEKYPPASKARGQRQETGLILIDETTSRNRFQEKQHTATAGIITAYLLLHSTTLDMPPKLTTAHKRLLRELRELMENPTEGIIAAPISDSDLFHWRCIITGPEDTPYEYGIFEATLDFPKEYPLSPPTLKFKTPIFHPNVYSDGKVCISILHEPGNDPLSNESADERWGPLQSIEKILLSVSSMIADPNPNSPANVDAGKLWRTDRARYDEIVRKQVVDSLSL
jgi:ubiquitin-conjugating enzyme E2 G2